MAKINCLFLLLSSSFGFSQTETLLAGKVVFDNKAVANVDIVNMSSKKGVTTDELGNYTISAKASDTLFVISKEYYDRKIAVSEVDLAQGHATIVLEKKPIQLEDVNVTKVKSMKIRLPQAELDAGRMFKEATAPKVLNVYDGTTPGVNFISLGKQVIDMFSSKNKKKPKKEVPLPEFKDYIRSTFADSFFIQKLKLKPDEIGLFVAYCETDPKAKSIVAANDFFESMDFLILKNEDFKKKNSGDK